MPCCHCTVQQLSSSTPCLVSCPSAQIEYPEGSLWRGHLIPESLYPEWGGFTLVEATRNLLWEAYKDPLNTRWGRELVEGYSGRGWGLAGGGHPQPVVGGVQGPP